MSDTRELRWWKSSRSGNQGGQCVEVASTGTTWYVRDSKNPTQGHLAVTPTAWHAFLTTVKAG